MNRILALVAFITLICFLGILAWKVHEFDLWIAIAFTVLLSAYDFFIYSRPDRKS